MAQSRYWDCLIYDCTSLESLPFCSELGERSPLGHSGDLQFFGDQVGLLVCKTNRTYWTYWFRKDENIIRPGSGLRFGFEVVVKPIQHRVIPKLRVLRLQNPMTFVWINQQL